MIAQDKNEVKARYTLLGNERIESKIDSMMQDIVSDALKSVSSENMKAIVLMGGYGRGEGGVYEYGGDVFPYNDFDFFVVFTGASFIDLKNKNLQLKALGKNLEEKYKIEIDLKAISEESIKDFPFTLMNFEMREGHRVVWGDKDIFRQMPVYDMNNFPLIEGTRLLLNRGALALMAEEILNGKKSLSEEEFQKCVKFASKIFLAAGDVYLMASGRYTSRYLEKKEIIGKSDLPPEFVQIEFGKIYAKAWEFKFKPTFPKNEISSARSVIETAKLVHEKALKLIEEKRLLCKITNWLNYVDILSTQKSASSLSGLLKNVILNFQKISAGDIWSTRRWFFKYPRERLFASLPFLLYKGEEKNNEILSYILPGKLKNSKRIGSADENYNVHFRKIFLELWERFN